VDDELLLDGHSSIDDEQRGDHNHLKNKVNRHDLTRARKVVTCESAVDPIALEATRRQTMQACVLGDDRLQGPEG
jgi:hypothetical protein